MKTIKLNNGQETIVDNEDFERVNNFSWYFTSHGYAMHKDKKYTDYLHRAILNAPKNKYIDHINGNKLDNRKENLRLCSFSQNLMNTRKRKNVSCEFKGVSWGKERSKWTAMIQINNKRIFLGRFTDKIEAAKSYDIAARKLFGEFAKTNF